jgi:hypothetical protein
VSAQYWRSIYQQYRRSIYQQAEARLPEHPNLQARCLPVFQPIRRSVRQRLPRRTVHMTYSHLDMRRWQLLKTGRTPLRLEASSLSQLRGDDLAGGDVGGDGSSLWLSLHAHVIGLDDLVADQHGALYHTGLAVRVGLRRQHLVGRRVELAALRITLIDGVLRYTYCCKANNAARLRCCSPCHTVLRRTNVWRRVTSPAEESKLLISGSRMARGSASLADAIPQTRPVLTGSGAEGDDNWRVRGCRFRLVRRQVAVILR